VAKHPNVPNQRARATDSHDTTEAQSRASLNSVCVRLTWA
jgi:hypothetical protein